MPFVKLDCGILDSTLWLEREMREVFITALLMAEPIEITEPTAQIEVNSLNQTGWMVPPGWYGFVPAAGVGILHRAKVPQETGLLALARLGQPEESSRSPEFDGRRLVRISGGYIVLNFIRYREKDTTTAERSKRWRQRQKEKSAEKPDEPSHRDATATHRVVTANDTIAEAEAEDRDQKVIASSTRAHARGQIQQANGSDARSGRPVFPGQRVVVHEFMFTECMNILGTHADAFDLHSWFYDLDAMAVAQNLVIPKRDSGAWLQSQLVAEAQRRGIPLRIAKPIEQVAGKLSQRLMAARENIRREAES